MAVTAKLFGNFKLALAQKKIDLSSDDIRLMLTTTAPNQDTWVYKSDVTGETSGTGYTAGGKTLTYSGVTRLAYNSSTNTVTFDAEDTSWPTSTLSAAYGVLYSYTSGGSDSLRYLIGYIDFGGTVSTTAGTFQVVWNSSGVLADTVA